MKRTGLAVVLAAATVAGLATAGAAAPTTPPEPETQVVKAIRGTCEIEQAGAQVVDAELTMTLPTSVPVGTPVQPKDIKLKITFSAGTVAALRQNQIATIEGIAGVQMKATDGTKPVLMPARGVVAKTELPETGPVTVDVAAKVDAKPSAPEPGKITLTLGPLELLLAQAKAEQETTGEVTPAVCEPDPAQDDKVGEVSVLKPAPEPTESQTSSPAPASTAPPGPSAGRAQAPKPGQRPNVAPLQEEEPAPDPCAEIPPDTYYFWSYYDLSGHTDIKKLKSGIDFGPGYLSSQVFFWIAGEFGEIYCGGVEGDLLWPVASGSFVAFGFVPTTADVTVIPVGRAEGRIKDGVFTGSAKVHLRLSNVRVNGTKLDVGPNCQTAQPVVMNLTSLPEEWEVFGGGTMQTDVTVPEYSGCGVTEDLDPLFTGLVSGPGNHTKLTFGPLNFCEPPDQACVPPLQRRR